MILHVLNICLSSALIALPLQSFTSLTLSSSPSLPPHASPSLQCYMLYIQCLAFTSHGAFIPANVTCHTLHLSPVHLLELSEHVAPTFIATWRWISSVLGGCWVVYHIYHKLQGTLCHMHHLRRKTCSIFSGRESYCRENQQLVRSAGMKTLLPRLDFIGKWWEEAVRIINKRIKLIIFAGSNLFLSSSFLRCCVLREASCYSSSWTRVSAACCVTFNTL